MTDYTKMSDEEYATEMAQALVADELQIYMPPRGGWVFIQSIILVSIKDRLYRRKPKPRRIKGYIAVSRENNTTNLYANIGKLPSWVKEEGWDIVYMDREVPE
jgi:hypothetical protein